MSYWEPNSVSQAHPRVSGENSMSIIQPRLGSGSSPRERGKLWWKVVNFLVFRLIPA